MSKKFVTLITAISGIVMLVEYFFQIPIIGSISSQFRSWAVVIAAFAMGLGTINLLQVHFDKIAKKREGMEGSIVFIISLFITIIIGLTAGQPSDAYQFIFQRLLVPLGGATFSILAFYLASASYRAFRARNLDTTLLLGSAMFVMLGNVPIGRVISPYLPALSTWLMDVPNNAGWRGIIISVAVGYIGISLRVLLGMQRSN